MNNFFLVFLNNIFLSLKIFLNYLISEIYDEKNILPIYT